MQSARFVPVLFLLMAVVFASSYVAQDRPITIRAGTLLDGKGGVQRKTNIVVQGQKIVRINPNVEPNAAAPAYDLRRLTVMPGMIDAHVHISWHFGKDGRYESRAESPADDTLYTVENLYVTLMAGFTTVQSVGAQSDVAIREAVARGIIPGPRVLRSIRQINENTGGPERGSIPAGPRFSLPSLRWRNEHDRT